MKKLYALIFLIVLLIACANYFLSSQQEESYNAQQSTSEAYFPEAPQPQPESGESVNTPSEAPEPQAFYPFVIPEIEHPYKDEMVQLLTEFGFMLIFPEFKSIEELDWASAAVSGNLYQLTYHLNNELFSQGGGIEPEEREALEEVAGASIVRLEDMNTVGRRYFGEEFSFPKNLICETIAPFEADPQYYALTSGAGLIPFKQYLLIDAQEELNHIIATFVPFAIDNISSDNTINGIDFFNFTESSSMYRANIEKKIVYHPEVEPIYYFDPVRLLNYVYLPVPQDQLGTLTVTFQIQDDGRLIAVSSRYGNSPVS